MESIAKFFNHDFSSDNFRLYDNNGKKIYFEDSNGNWWKREYDNNGNVIYLENSTGYWYKYEYDNNNNVIYHENSYGCWYKYKYDNNNKIYHENSDGYWSKQEYDNNGNVIYLENSTGYIKDNRPSKILSVKDLKPGTFAIVNTSSEKQELVYIFYSTPHAFSNLPIGKHMVSLKNSNRYWSYVEKSEIPVIQVLQPIQIIKLLEVR